MTRGLNDCPQLASASPARNLLALRALTGALLALTAACGGAAFQRAPGAPRCSIVPPSTKTRVAATIADLPAESRVLGTLNTTTRGDPASRVDAEQALRATAGRYGCDAVANLESKRRETRKTKKVPTQSANGGTTWQDETVITVEHDWTAQCIRTPDLPCQAVGAAPPPAKEEPEEVKVEPVRPKKRASDNKPRPEVKPEPKPEPKLEPKPRAEVKVEPKPEPKIDPKPRPEAKPEAKVEAVVEPKPRAEVKLEPKPEPKVEVRPEPKVEIAPDAEQPMPVVVTSAEDKKIASEIANMFIRWSNAWVKNEVDKLCSSFDDKVILKISSNQPKLKMQQEMTAAEACQSLKDGDLSSYLKELGPAEVHAEVGTLVPALFGVHGGSFLNLEPDVQKRYAQAVAVARLGKKPLACSMYTVTPREEGVYQISLTCQGTASFKVFVAKAADGTWKVRTFSHVQ